MTENSGRTALVTGERVGWRDDALFANRHGNTVGSRFTTGLRSRIFGCKSNRRKTSTI